jgi:hypothetical protein
VKETLPALSAAVVIRYRDDLIPDIKRGEHMKAATPDADKKHVGDAA